MLDFAVIFTKGGVTLWSYNPLNGEFSSNVNNLIRGIILEDRSVGGKYYEHANYAMQFALDNELELVFLVVYHKAIHLPYVDGLLNELQVIFRKRYKNALLSVNKFGVHYDFDNEFRSALHAAESQSKSNRHTKPMRTFKESMKSKKTVASMIENPSKSNDVKKTITQDENQPIETSKHSPTSREDTILENRKKLIEKLAGKKSPQEGKRKGEQEKVGKKPRVWEFGKGNAKDAVALDRSRDTGTTAGVQLANIHDNIVGTMQGQIKDLEIATDDDIDNDNGNADDDDVIVDSSESTKHESKKKSGLLSYFKGIIGSKVLTQHDLQPVLSKMRDHLISKNVAADISNKLCESVAANLEGKSLGTLNSTASVVKSSLTTSLIRILTPKRRIDIIRDAIESKRQNIPYVIIFCGVNGVGKSTNLAKICFWLIENDFNVLIAACDTFRAGAVEQLRTHTSHLNALHPPERHHHRTMVQLYEKGYGKDAAGIAMEAIKFAKETNVDIVLVDTAGRMQDNEPLMRSLSKLIKVNSPHLVLFVGEALVGNEAVDQLMKFNQALANFSSSEHPHTIDGIVLTKFDTIDDKVGAAISMTYATGQPIVFVGTGQTYSDLKTLNVNAVVNALMK